MTTFLHSADWQLGMTRHFLRPENQATFSAARIGAVAAIGALARQRRCPFVVVAGDVFETNQVGRKIVAQALDAMAGCSDVTFYLLPGNHDPLDAASVFRSRTFLDHQPRNVVVLDDSAPVPVGDGLELVAAPWFSKRPLADLVTSALAPLAGDGTVRVAVGHGVVDALSPDPSDPAAVALASLESALDAGVVHYVALGDRHSTTSVGRTGRVWYAGTPEATDYDEVDPGNVLAVTLEAGKCTVEVLPIGTWRFVRRSVHVAGRPDCEELERWLSSLEDKARTVVKLDLVGQLGVGDKSRLDAVLAHHADLLGALEIGGRRTDLVVLPNDDDVGDLGLVGYARAALEDLRAMAEAGGDQATVARDALGLLYRLAGGPSSGGRS